ncbi:hypothetical protein G7077_09025 [Sphingomonas piscis]|uniref:Uncharacterized protein n=1 Tax=Sphingomonas piscis TaxID=2714943 RepID=A0A6G7YLB1_9SPHN|nr:hypothetical protein [Sphingomonas piscis]QIK77533.1 hypothetical protein G7077_09025 [Sphingomonas piscis]
MRLPEQLFASVRLAPEGGSIQGFTKAAGIVAGDGWVAGIGDTWWAAERALKAADVRIEAKNNPIPVDALFDDALAAGDATRWYERGDYAGAVEGSRALSAIYRVAPALPFGLEAPNATARVSGDRVEVWAGTQAPGLARMRADHAAGGESPSTRCPSAIRVGSRWRMPPFRSPLRWHGS